MEKSIGYLRDAINSNPKVLRITGIDCEKRYSKVVFPCLSGD